ncbi:hypothetical protein AMJ47_00500 [Parcubacteria bacterium DG_72]|nr:MAG: hypothetical protein AMJ47_00500 [Parcubacteria bacterium DG_72]
MLKSHSHRHSFSLIIKKASIEKIMRRTIVTAAPPLAGLPQKLNLGFKEKTEDNIYINPSKRRRIKGKEILLFKDSLNLSHNFFETNKLWKTNIKIITEEIILKRMLFAHEAGCKSGGAESRGKIAIKKNPVK